MVCGWLSVTRRLFLLPCFPSFPPQISDLLWGESFFQLFFCLFVNCEDWFNTSAFTEKAFLFLFASFFHWWRSVHGLFLEIFVVVEQLPLFHCPSVLPCWEMCTLGQVAARCWGRIASGEGLVLQITITLSNGIYWVFPCTWSCKCREARQPKLLCVLMTVLILISDSAPPPCSIHEIWPNWIAKKLFKMLALVQLTALFLIQDVLGPFNISVPSAGDLGWLQKQWFPQCKWYPQRRRHGQTKQYPACSFLQGLKNFMLTFPFIVWLLSSWRGPILFLCWGNVWCFYTLARGKQTMGMVHHNLLGRQCLIKYQGRSTGPIRFIQKAVGNKVVGLGACLTQFKILCLQLPFKVIKIGLSRGIKRWWDLEILNKST